MRKFLFYCFVIGLLFGIPTSLSAADFTANYDIDYAVAPTGSTIVTQKIQLTNQKTDIYPKKYALTIDTDRITNVIAYDEKGMISPALSKHDGKTDIEVTFNTHAVGMGKVLPFELRYEQGDIAVKNGTIWEINIPGIKNDPAIQSYSVRLRTPPQFGSPTYLKPVPSNDQYWTKEQLLEGGISAAYGSSQTFTVQITYDLENTKLTSETYEIALPPDTSYQKVFVKSIDPKPITNRKDIDGNWLFRYEIPGNTKMTVTGQIIVSTYINPREDYQTDVIQPTDFLVPIKYWDSNAPLISEIAKKYSTPKQIYDFVVSSLSYNEKRSSSILTRKGALEALKKPEDSLCSEFTDLFISIARAAGIPAREIVGFAYTTNSKLRPQSGFADILHAWPEYYDKEKHVWIPVDPTWGKTTNGVDYFSLLDFNHIAFVIHGISSETPYPAGSFRQGTISKKNVQVGFADTTPAAQKESLKISLDLPKKIPVLSNVSKALTVQNLTGVTVSDLVVNVTSYPYPFKTTLKVQNIPPFGTVRIPIEFRIIGLPTKKASVTVTTNSTVATFPYETTVPSAIIFGIGAIGFGLGIIVWLLLKRR